MKKSEVLGKIWEILYEHTDVEEERLPEICEKVLEKLEDCGMAPPNVCNTPDGWIDDKKYAGYLHSGKDMYFWEEEND